MRRFGLVFVAALLALSSGVALLPPQTAAAEPTSVTNQFKNIPVTGNVTDRGGGKFEGVLNITQFEVQGNKLVAVGTVEGTLTKQNAEPQTVPPTPVSWPVDKIRSGQGAQGDTGSSTDTFDKLGSADQVMGPADQTCNILTLVLGPLDLNLLGLRVQLNQVNLVISAIEGAGALLGNLLCAIAGLLDPGGNLPTLATALQSIADSLNQIIGILGV